jgi:hypothetical protein
MKLKMKQESIQKSNEKPTVTTQGQNYSKVTLHTKTFPTIPIMWRLVVGNPVFCGDKGEATKWKIFIYRLIPGQRHNKRAFKKWKTNFLPRLEPPPTKQENWKFGSYSFFGQLDALRIKSFFRVAAIQILGFQSLFHTCYISHARYSIQLVACNF